MLDIILLALGLSADAATVSIGIGCSKPKLEKSKSLLVGGSFGLAQALMPLIGAAIGTVLYSKIAKYSPYIIFAILGFLGGKMLIESFKNDDSCKVYDEINLKLVFPLAIATSIDAMAAGFILPMMKANIFVSTALIGIITFVVCLIALRLGKTIGCHIKNGSEKVGGILLIIIAVLALFKF